MTRNSLALALVVLGGIAAAVVFSLTGHAIPDWDGAVVLAGAGALAGIVIPGEGAAAQGSIQPSDFVDFAHHAVTELAALFDRPAAPVAAGSPSDASAPAAAPLPEPAPATDAAPGAGV